MLLIASQPNIVSKRGSFYQLSDKKGIYIMSFLLGYCCGVLVTLTYIELIVGCSDQLGKVIGNFVFASNQFA